MTISIEEIWNKVVEHDEGDPPIRLLCEDEFEATRIRSLLAAYKHRTLAKDDNLRDALGEFRLQFNMSSSNTRQQTEVVLHIDITYDQPGARAVKAEIL